MQLGASLPLLLGGLATVTGQLPAPAQTYYVPLPEVELFDSFTDLNPPLVAGNVRSVLSIAIAADNTLVYYDHWEDGYDDLFLANPASKQASTQIWGDGDLTNGIAPGTTNDILSGGTAIVLDNEVEVAPRGTAIRFDGRDSIQATLPIAVTRYAYPTEPGSLMAGAVEVFNQANYGRRFVAPIGQTNIGAGTTDGFEYTRFYVMAGSDGTTLKRNGVQIGTGVLNRGDHVDFAVNQGDVVTADRPVQVDIFAGDVLDNFELRWYAQVDADEWTNEYISPTCEVYGNTGFWFHNPDPTKTITISWTGGNTNSGSFVVGPNSSKIIPASTTAGPDQIQVLTGDTFFNQYFAEPNRYSGIKFTSTDNFYAFAQIDSDTNIHFGGNGQVYDWGFPMIPSTQLTSQVLVGLGRGCTDSCISNTDQGVLGSRSVVWVTPVANTNIFVDYDGDGVFDFTTPLGELGSIRLTDDPGGAGQGDFDMTGAIIASSTGVTVDGQPQGGPIRIAVAWGQDPARSNLAQAESLDLGTVILPLANPDVLKDVRAIINPDGTVDPRKIVDQVGDIISYIIIVSNVGFADLTNVQVADPLIQAVLVGPVESKTTDNILERGETFTYFGNYTVTASDMSSMGGGDSMIENEATVSTAEFPPVDAEVETPIFLASISGNVKEDTDTDNVGNVNIPGVTIQLRDSSNAVIATTLTDSLGNYLFTNVQAGDYVVRQVNLPGYIDVTDSDGGNKNNINVNGLVGLQHSENNDFVDERPGTISGTVTDNFSVALVGVTINLVRGTTVVLSTTTNASGFYEFTNVTPGDYTVQEINPTDYVSVSDQDNSNDNDPTDSNTDVDDEIGVRLNSNEDDTNNDFVDRLRNGAISGKVTSDDGTILPNTRIDLVDSNNNVIASQLTDRLGEYLFSDVFPGDYTIVETNRADHPNDVSDQDTSNDGDTFDSNTVVDNMIKARVAPGELDANNDFVDSNNGKITGSVIDQISNPIPGVLISLNVFSDNSTVATTTTDSNGFYSFDEVEPGDYMLHEQNLPSYPKDVSDRDTDPDGDSFDSNTAVDNKIGVTLAPGETDKGNDFQDSNFGKITGTVKNDNGVALINVKVELLDSDGTTVLRTTTTDAAGAYEFDDVSPGDYTVKETNPTEYPANISDQDNKPDGDPTDSNTDVDNLIGVKLEAGETDEGNDFVDGDNGSISGTVKDDNALAIPNVLIELLKDGTVIASTATQSDGSYEFKDVEPGTYQVKETNAAGYATDVSDQDDSPEDAGVDSNTIVDNLIDVVLNPSEKDTDNNFVDSDNGTISGTVKDDSGIALTGVTITLETQPGASGATVVATTLTDSNGAYLFSDVEPGLYVVLEENPVDYPSNVRDFDTTPDGDAGETDAAADDSILVTLQQSEDDTGNDFVDSNNGSISGSVKDDEGNAIAGITVVLTDSNGAETTAITNLLGNYVFSDLEPGSYTVTETNSALFPKDVSDRDEDGDNDPQDSNTVVDNQIGVTLAPGESDKGNNFVDSNKGTISGNVKSADGNFLDGVQIDLLDGTTVIATTKTDSNGDYLFEDVKPGKDYRVIETNRADYPSSISDGDNSPDDGGIDGTIDNDDEIRVVVTPGEDDKDNDFVDDNDGAISGSVRDDDGNALVGVTVKLTHPDGSLVSQVTTNAEGKYLFSQVEPGEYVVTETNPSTHPNNVRDGDESNDGDSTDGDLTADDVIKVTLTAGELDADNNFVDSNKGSISGQVTDDEDVPLEDVIITLLDENSTVVATTSTNSQGGYTFPDVPPGDYLLNETNPPGYPDDEIDIDVTPDGDDGEENPVPDSLIPVTITPGENDDGNDFKDSNDGAISGHVTSDTGIFLPGAKIELIQNGVVIDTAITGNDGFYKFVDVEPGDYTVKETNPTGYPVDVSDQDNSNDSDTFDTDTVVDNEIGVTVQPGEEDKDNDFKDSNKGSILGTVKDDNTNPIAGVPIQLQRLLNDGTIEVVDTTITDSNGDYSFTNVEPGKYTLVETNLPAFPNDISDKDTTNDGDDQDANTAIDNKIGVTLKPGEIDDGNDFVDGAKGSITGTVRNDNGVFLSGVTVELLMGTTVIRTTTTNAGGSYAFEGVEPGDYIVKETNPTLFPANIMDQDTKPDGDPTDSNTDVDNSIGVRLIPGEIDEGNDFVDGDNGSISGTVKDDNKLAIPGVVIELLEDGNVIATTATTSDGSYIFEDVEPGKYQLREINPEGYTDLSDQDDSPDDTGVDDNTVVDNLIDVILNPAEKDTGNNFVDSDNGSISGTVTDDANNALASVNITLVDPASGNTVASTTTDSNGAYLFSDVEPGDYIVQETNPVGYPSNVRDFDTTPDGDPSETDQAADNTIAVRLEKGEDDDGNDFQDSNNGSISGTVLDDDGNPLSGVTLTLENEAGEVVETATTNSQGVYIFNDVEPGTYTVVETNPEGYPDNISDQDDDPDGDGTDGNTVPDNRIGVTLEPNESDGGNNFVDSNKGTISGTVTSDNEVYLTGVLIQLMDSTGLNVIQTQATDGIGNYKFENVAPGQYFVIETNPDNFPSNILDEDRSPDDGALDADKEVDNSIPVNLTPGEDDEDNDFVDGDNGSISGSVKDDNGAPLSNVKVELKLANGTVLSEAFTNIAGNYTFSNIEPGDYTIEETNPSTHPIDVSDGDDSGDGDTSDGDNTPDNKISVTLTPGESDSDNNFVDSNKGTISGTVSDDENEPLTNVTIALKDENGTVIETTTTDSNGEYTFPGIDPGNYTLEETNPPGYPDDISDVDTTPDGDEGETDTVPDNKIPVTLTPGEDDDGNNFQDGNDGSISGLVQDDQSIVLEGVAIELLDANGQSIANTTTNENGVYKFDDVEPGDYTVVETNPAGYPGDVYDEDKSPDGDSFDSDKTVDNRIGVTVDPGEADENNDFMDSNNGNILGTVKDDNGNPIANVPIQLQQVGEDGVTFVVVLDTMTDSNGDYSFNDIEPGTYKVVETNLPAYPTDISDKDTTPDGDSFDNGDVLDNEIGVVVQPGETDDGNDFVNGDNGEIRGTVKNDNLIGLSGVTVELFVGTNATGPVFRSTTTNGNGEYVFDDLEPGDYVVKETNPTEYPANIMDQDTNPDGDPTDSNTDVDNLIGVRLTPGESDIGNDFVDGDNGSISGTVKDDNSSPIPDVVLELLLDGTVIASTTSGPDGVYTFGNVEPGTYQVKETNPPGYTSVSDQDDSPDDGAADSDTTVDDLITVVLAPNENDMDNNFVDSDNGSISGTVSADDGTLLPSVAISLVKKTDGTPVASTTTDINGNYVFSDVEPGDYYVLETNPEGYPSNVKDQDSTPDGDADETDTSADNSIAVTLEKSENDDGNDFEDSNKGSISGTVLNDNGEPLKDVKLELEDETGTVIDTVTTNSNGEYTFNKVEPGKYTVVETNPEGYPDNISDQDESPDADDEDDDTTVDNRIGVTLVPGESDSGNNFVDGDNGSISGTVKNDNGGPLDKVTVMLIRDDGETVSTKQTDVNGFYNFTNVEPGVYTVVEINPTLYPSNVRDQDDSPDDGIIDQDTQVDNSIPVVLQPGEADDDNNFVDSDNGSISGSVKDEEGKPLSGVTVKLTTPDGTLVAEVTTNANGAYTFNNIDPGDYIIEETNPSTHPIDVSDGDDSPDGDTDDSDNTPDNKIKVTLAVNENDTGNNFVDSDKGTISGTVSDDENEPLTNVTIALKDENGTVIETTTTDSNGEYTFPGIDPGNYTLEETNPPGYPDDISDVDTTPDGDEGETDTVPDNKIPVTLTPGEDDDGNNFQDGNDGSISGLVQDDQSIVLEGVAIELLDANGQSIANTTTNENGVYKFDDVEPGDYTVVETNPAGYPGDVYDEDKSPDGDSFDSDKTVDNRIGVTVDPGEADENNDFMDSNNGNILGTVKDDNGNPIANVPIQLQGIKTDGSVEIVGNTLTDSNGDYSFNDIEPGDYTIAETNLPTYPNDVSDKDTTPDGDTGDDDTAVDNKIAVTLTPGETDDGNDFVDSDNGVVGGSVVDDNGNPIPNTPIKLTKPDGTVVMTTLSDSNGDYTFTNVEPGDYNIVEENLPEFPGDVSDHDVDPDGDASDGNKTVDNVIGVTIKPGENDVGNNFVDTDNGSISGSVTDDNGNPLGSVLLTLVKPDGTAEDTTVTDSNGQYVFEDVEPGNYKVVETNPVGFPTDISDKDTIPEGDDPFDTDTTVDNEIGVSLNPGEEDKGNDFVDGNNGSITGTVTGDSGDPLEDVLITLTYPNGTSVTTTTDSNGVYSFDNLEPGDYGLEETNPDGYPHNLSDQDETPDGDIGDDDRAADNKIAVTVQPGEIDDGNNFVDILASESPSSTPSLITPSPIATAPPVSVTISPSNQPSITASGSPSNAPSLTPSTKPSPAPSSSPSLPPSAFCEEVADTNCTLCAPYRSLDYCKPEESFPTLISNRTKVAREDSAAVFNDGYWFHYLEDKIAAYILSVGQNMPAPEIFCCVTNATALAECLESDNVPPSMDGIVIKATNMHSNQGVFVLVDDNNGLPLDLISGMHLSISDVVAALAEMQATKIIAEEFIGTALPTEYKFHVVNGQVAAIDVIANRGGECPCYAVVDTDWNRLDSFGCFEPGGYEFTDSDGCTSIDFTTGQRKAGAVKKDLYLCEDVDQPTPCILEEMTELALSLASTIGVYMRIDMFVANNQVFVQEYTPNHMNGMRHCMAKREGDCIDSCFVGRMWEEAGQPFGGTPTPVPALLDGFQALSAQEQCDLLTQLPKEPYFPKCAAGGGGTEQTTP